MITVRYFARFREMLGCEQEELEFTEQTATAEKLMTLLSTRGERWKEIFDSDRRILVAVNQDMVHAHTVIQDGDEVAFFPPVTGG